MALHKSRINLGDLIVDREYGVCTVVGVKRTGHQYERYYEYELLSPSGNVIITDEYDIDINMAKNKDCHVKLSES